MLPACPTNLLEKLERSKTEPSVWLCIWVLSSRFSTRLVRSAGYHTLIPRDILLFTDDGSHTRQVIACSMSPTTVSSSAALLAQRSADAPLVGDLSALLGFYPTHSSGLIAGRTPAYLPRSPPDLFFFSGSSSGGGSGNLSIWLPVVGAVLKLLRCRSRE